MLFRIRSGRTVQLSHSNVRKAERSKAHIYMSRGEGLLAGSRGGLGFTSGVFAWYQTDLMKLQR